MNKFWKLTVGAAALAVSCGAQAGVIDLFSTDQAILTDTSNGGFNTTDALDSQAGSAGDLTILGGFRDLVVSALSGASVSPLRSSSIEVGGGELLFTNSPSVTGVGQIQWDGDDSGGDVFDIDYTGLGGIDLTGGGSLNSFELVTLFSDLNWTFDITIYTDAGNWTKIDFDASSVQIGSPLTSFIPFSAFIDDSLCGDSNPAPGVNLVTCGGSGADVTNVGAIVTTLNTSGTVAIDLELDQVTTVPEPGVLALMGIGLLAIGLGSRRSRNLA